MSNMQKEAKSINWTHIHDGSLTCIGTGTSIKSGGVKESLKIPKG